jgi:hypothetical protein
VRRATVYKAAACPECGGHRFGVGRGDDPLCSNECTFDYWAKTGQYPRFVGQASAGPLSRVARAEFAKTPRTPAMAGVGV